MRDSALAILGLVSFAVPALGANTPAPPPGGVAAAPDGGLVISSQICGSLAGTTATPGVPSADYQPGVDVSGNAVAPADLPSAPSTPTVDNFPIEIDQHLASRVHLPPGASSKAILGYVTVHGNQAYFNGQPLNADQSAALAEACHQAHH
jgi:hypothetical protein